MVEYYDIAAWVEWFSDIAARAKVEEYYDIATKAKRVVLCCC